MQVVHRIVHVLYSTLQKHGDNDTDQLEDAYDGRYNHRARLLGPCRG